MTQIVLTEKEIEVIKAIPEVNARRNLDSFVGDNFSWFEATDIIESTRLNAQAVGGIMASLQDKGVISYTQEVNDYDGPGVGKTYILWFLNEDKIKSYKDQVKF